MTNIVCGTARILRSSALARLVKLECHAAHVAAQEGEFDANVVVATLEGEWLFRCGCTQPAAIDPAWLVVGNGGDRFSCRHSSFQPTKALAVYLLPGAIDDETPLFSKKILKSNGIERLFLRALDAASEDDFDSIVFNIFSEASSLSLYPENASGVLRTERAKRFIEAHAFENVTLADLANELGLSPFTVIRQFKAATGKTPHAYLLEVRLDAAKRLLLGTSASVESIARSVGFEDSGYFARLFKRRTGVTPSGFRAA